MPIIEGHHPRTNPKAGGDDFNKSQKNGNKNGGRKKERKKSKEAAGRI